MSSLPTAAQFLRCAPRSAVIPCPQLSIELASVLRSLAYATACCCSEQKAPSAQHLLASLKMRLDARSLAPPRMKVPLRKGPKTVEPQIFQLALALALKAWVATWATVSALKAVLVGCLSPAFGRRL